MCLRNGATAGGLATKRQLKALAKTASLLILESYVIMRDKRIPLLLYSTSCLNTVRSGGWVAGSNPDAARFYLACRRAGGGRRPAPVRSRAGCRPAWCSGTGCSPPGSRAAPGSTSPWAQSGGPTGSPRAGRRSAPASSATSSRSSPPGWRRSRTSRASCPRPTCSTVDSRCGRGTHQTLADQAG